MSLLNILQILQIITAVLLITAILLQAKGAALGITFGGSGNVFRTKRGAEKILFWATIALAVVFFAAVLAPVFIAR